MPIELAPTFKPGTPMLLFEAPYSLAAQHPSNAPSNYDVAADGLFFMFQEVGAQVQEIPIVTELHEELERLAPHR